MRIAIIIFFVFLGNSLSIGQIAGKNGMEVYSLRECLEIALKNNYEIKLADARKEASSADVTNAFGQFLPYFSISSNYNRTLNEVFFTEYQGQLIPITNYNPNNYSLYVGGQWTIFDGFTRGNNYSRAHDLYNAIDLNAQHIRNRIKIQVYQNYIDVIAKSQIVKIRKENLELGNKELERTKAQHEAGLISIDMVYSQEADLGNKEYELVTAENALNQAKATLLVSMGLTPDFEAEFLESSLPNSIDSSEIADFRNEYLNFNKALELAFLEREDYQAAEHNLHAGESSLKGSYSGYYPKISLSGGWSWSNYEIADLDKLGISRIGLSFNMPIFDQFSTNLQIQNAELQLEQARIEKRQLEQNIVNTIKTAFLNLEASEKQLEISERALKSAEMNNESMREKFRVGAASITEYLTANAQYITSQINRINSVYQYFRSQKEVLYAIGKLE